MKSLTLLCGLILSTLVFAQTVTIDLSTYSPLRYNTVTRIKVGDTFEVILAENPTTGYLWEIFVSELKKGGLYGIIHPRGHTYQADETNIGVSGGSGVRKYSFVALKEGEGDLNFIYGRPWETNKKYDAGEDLGSLVQKIVPIVVYSENASKPDTNGN